MVWRNGRAEDLGTLGGQNIFAYAINNTGQVVGEAGTADGRTAGFVWQAGSIRQLPIDQPNVQSYNAASINDAGNIVGTASVDTLNTRALYWSGPDVQPQTLADPAGHSSPSASTSIGHSAIVWR